MGLCYKNILVLLTATVSFSLIMFFTFMLPTYWNQVDKTAISTVMGYVSGGTLSLGALSLTVLAYSLSEVRSRETSRQKAPYRRLAMIAYLITPLSLTDAIISILYVLTEMPYSFETSLALLYAIVIILIALVSLWIMEDL